MTVWLEGELGFKVNNGPLYDRLLKKDVRNALVNDSVITPSDERRVLSQPHKLHAASHPGGKIELHPQMDNLDWT